ncbi:MAG: hypothetical protein HHJ12_17795 [Glaciimonas sp.]|nr:hypothetical protein [Glaciimonas sp.]
MVSLNICIDGTFTEDDRAAAIEKDVEELSTVFKDSDLDARPTNEHVFLRAVGRYTAYAIDLEYLWRWEIYLEADQLVQDGGSISLASATEAVDHVLAYFSARDINTICGTSDDLSP